MRLPLVILLLASCVSRPSSPAPVVAPAPVGVSGGQEQGEEAPLISDEAQPAPVSAPEPVQK